MNRDRRVVYTRTSPIDKRGTHSLHKHSVEWRSADTVPMYKRYARTCTYCSSKKSSIFLELRVGEIAQRKSRMKSCCSWFGARRGHFPGAISPSFTYTPGRNRVTSCYYVARRLYACITHHSPFCGPVLKTFRLIPPTRCTDLTYITVLDSPG